MRLKTTSLMLAVCLLFCGYYMFQSKYANRQDLANYNTKKKTKSKPKKKSITVGEFRYDGPEKYAYIHQAIRTGRIDPENVDMSTYYKSGYQKKEFELAKENREIARTNRRIKAYSFIERGPVNVPGRTRGIIVDPEDNTGNTWFAGSVGGGIWKTENAGELWTELTTSLPNIAFTTLAMPASNPNVIYAGTGEGSFAGLGSINGTGIYKSTDKGESWNLLSSTNTDNFTNVSRIIVNPDNADELLACTTNYSFRNSATRNSYIYKSTNGGTSWELKYTSRTGSDVQQLVATPDNFSILYAAVNNVGVFKSTDAGETWEKASLGLITNDLNSSDGLLGSSTFGRLELAVAENNTDIVYASVEGSASGNGSDLYVSFDAAESWSLVEEENNNTNPDWLQSQGWYDNTITVHPYNDSIVYAAGISTWKMTIGEPIDTTETTIVEYSFNNIESFADVVNIFSDEGEQLQTTDYVDIEIRFGDGVSQLAHRFTVPAGSTSGVPSDDYTYQDYVEVPFEVWDVTNNRQLMASFRDNDRNGEFNLISDYNSSREYVYVNVSDYANSPNVNIAQDGGQIYKSLYLVWLYSPNNNFNAQILPTSSIDLDIIQLPVITYSRSSQVINDPYSQAGGLNNNVHPDHHNLITIKGNGESFRILNANDGGVYITDSSTDPGVFEGAWNAVGNTYNTAQFYGADKKKGSDEYVGGTQDNGTWLSQGEAEDAESEYRMIISGDGFEVVWHYQDTNKIIGGAQYNTFVRTLDGGNSFETAVSGLEDDGPFVSRLANSKSDPDILYAVGSSGVYKSIDFGGSWDSKPISTRWGFWSGTDVEISLANPQIVWAGSGMTDVRSIQLSTDGGESFDVTNNYPDEIGLATGIYSHPFQDSTAYVLFSISERPKVLRTTDLGNSWEDISGYGDESTSTGFPNVAVYSLLVMPHDTMTIWAGTEIGIVESTDNGQNWQLLDSNLPSVSVWDMKIVDDQVVIATHGRGIWTVTIPELADYSPADVILTPLLYGLSQGVGINSLNLDVDIRSDYDSVQIVGNNEVLYTLYNPITIGRALYVLSPIDEGILSVTIIGFKDGQEYISGIQEINISTLIVPVTSYSTDFNQPNGDFKVDGFLIGTDDGFDNATLHTKHPYPVANDVGKNELNFTATLTTPIIVAESNATINYKDVAIVEPGESGTIYGDSEFWDYVIVEGSRDGISWVALAPGYDAGSNSAWQTAYNAENDGDQSLFVDQEIDILETFNAGDTIMVRFRLYSDPFASGWGWAIDNLEIQVDGVTATNSGLEQQMKLYPNPSRGVVTVTIENALQGKIEAKVMDVIGEEILTKEINNTSGSTSFKFDLNNYPKGVYIIQLSDGKSKIAKKLILE
ncbi:MAG: hypothetical protein CMO01_17995 [Thalassobius sp.]|nr:hypothetical protein [Thalassovita sp.]